MKLVEQIDIYATYQYDSFEEFLMHISENEKYFIGSFLDDDGFINAEFYREILKNKNKDINKKKKMTPKFIVSQHTENTIPETAYPILINLALDIKDEEWFNQLSALYIEQYK